VLPAFRAVPLASAATTSARSRDQNFCTSVRCRRLTRHRRQANDSVGVGEGMEIIQLSLFRPPVAKQSTHRKPAMVLRHFGSTLEQPLRRIVGPRLR